MKKRTRRIARHGSRRNLHNKHKGGAADNKDVSAEILDQASTQVLRITMPPGTSIITDQNTMAFMTGNLVTSASMDGGAGVAERVEKPLKGAGFLNAVKRVVTGQSFFINYVRNPTDKTAEITLSPTIPSAIAEITLEPGEEWKIYPGCVLATTANVRTTGSLKFFENFKASFVTGEAFYTSLRVAEGDTKPGRAWICGFGGIERRDIKPSETPFILNNGVFLAMPAKHWNTYVSVGTPGSILDSFMTDLGFVMKIQAPAGGGTVPTMPLYLQTLNVHNFKGMIRSIAADEARSAARSSTRVWRPEREREYEQVEESSEGDGEYVENVGNADSSNSGSSESA